jgi:hypothetical protein
VFAIDIGFSVGDEFALALVGFGVALFAALDVEPQRAIATPESNYVFVAQLRPWLPGSIGNVLWYAPGPADSSRCGLSAPAGSRRASRRSCLPAR